MATQYFKSIPNTLYAFNNTQILEVKHIFRRFGFYKTVKDNTRSFDTYTILEGEYPDTVSHKFYGTSDLHWIILIFNGIIDPFGQWPMTHENLLTYVRSKYGIGNEYNNAHWVNAVGKTVDPAYYLGVLNTDGTYTQDITPLTNYDYEQLINDSKRKIYIPRKEYISKITSEIEKIFDVS